MAARRKRIKKEIDPLTGKPEAGGVPTFEWVDIKTGEVFAEPRDIITKKERAAATALPEPQRKEALLEQFRRKGEAFREAQLPPELRERKEAAKVFLEERGIFEEELPKKVQLDPERIGVEGFPVIGPSMGAFGAVGVGEKSIIGLIRKLFNLKPKDPIEPLIQNPETARELALQEIQKEVIKKGLSDGERFGTFIEGIPVVGSLANKYASGLIEDPRGNIATVLSELDSERERASVIAEKAFTGKLGDPFLAVEQIEDIERNVARLEQRMKLLANSSPALRADADALNKIEEKILRTKERIFIAKQAAAGGLLAPATDSNIFLALKELKGS